MQHPTHLFSQDGIFNVNLNIITNNGCVDDTTLNITVYPNPIVDFQSPNQFGCSEWCVDFVNNTSINTGNIASYYWDLGNGFQSSLNSPTQCYVNDGTSSEYYDITLYAMSDYDVRVRLP